MGASCWLALRSGRWRMPCRCRRRDCRVRAGRWRSSRRRWRRLLLRRCSLLRLCRRRGGHWCGALRGRRGRRRCHDGWCHGVMDVVGGARSDAAVFQTRACLRQDRIRVGMMPRFRFTGCDMGARRRDRPGLTCFRTEAPSDHFDCSGEGQAVCLQQFGGTAVAIANDSSKNDAAIDVIAAPARGCGGSVQDPPQLI